ncbi:hypothetical protein JD844_032177 [Phrynosoma platyrhinos]|uniref:Uncharacterized protein n=1 Tax=Phrynosoma platyrhinos TaxID=52577 RepID=A0ABQ7T5C3_PHRPL|nr:hypothetical protein JD844_032177 [Phrynosoma platyrhinos]
MQILEEIKKIRQEMKRDKAELKQDMNNLRGEIKQYIKSEVKEVVSIVEKFTIELTQAKANINSLEKQNKDLQEEVKISEAKKTKVKKKTNNPQFDEVFYFEVTKPCSYNKKSHFDIEDADEVDKMEIRVDLWNASNLKFGDEFLGELRLPLKCLRQSSSYEAWHFLQPRDNGNKSLKPDDLGSLRLNVVYTEDHVFPSDYYSPLRDLLLKSADVEFETCRLYNIKLSAFRDPNTIFRGNSLTSKCIDETMKLAGMHYLQVTLKPIIDEICQLHKPCEIDPVKLKDAENLENNRENLRQYVDRIFTVISKSGVSCPTVMCDIFFSLRESAAIRFQDDPDVRYTAVSSFIFLRFFAPAILSPNLFHLTPHHPVSLASS